MNRTRDRDRESGTDTVTKSGTEPVAEPEEGPVEHPAAGSAYAGWITALGITIGIAALASSTPWLPPDVRTIVMRMFSGVCHQLPDRSPHVAGVQLAVCHRCFGIYWAMPVAALLFRALRGAWPFRGRAAATFLLISVVPAGVDWIGDVLGWWTNTPASRMLTGGLFGLTAGYFLARAIGDIVSSRRAGRVASSASSA